MASSPFGERFSQKKKGFFSPPGLRSPSCWIGFNAEIPEAALARRGARLVPGLRNLSLGYPRNPLFRAVRPNLDAFRHVLQPQRPALSLGLRSA